MDHIHEMLTKRCDAAYSTLALVADAIATTVELNQLVRAWELRVQILDFLVAQHTTGSKADEYRLALRAARIELERLQASSPIHVADDVTGD